MTHSTPTNQSEELRNKIYEATKYAVMGQYMRDENGDYQRMFDTYDVEKDHIADEMEALIRQEVLGVLERLQKIAYYDSSVVEFITAEKTRYQMKERSQ